MRPDALTGWNRDDLQAALAAFRVTMDLLPDGWPRAADGEGPEFFLRAERFALFESHKGRYRILQDWPLN